MRFAVYEWRASDGGPGGPWLLVGPFQSPDDREWVKKYPILRSGEMVIVSHGTVAAFEPSEIGQTGGWVSWSAGGLPTEPLPGSEALSPKKNKTGGMRTRFECIRCDHVTEGPLEDRAKLEAEHNAHFFTHVKKTGGSE